MRVTNFVEKNLIILMENIFITLDGLHGSLSRLNGEEREREDSSIGSSIEIKRNGLKETSLLSFLTSRMMMDFVLPMSDTLPISSKHTDSISSPILSGKIDRVLGHGLVQNDTKILESSSKIFQRLMLSSFLIITMIIWRFQP